MFSVCTILRTLFFLVLSLAMNACGEFIKDDLDFDVDNRSADISIENAEIIALEVLQVGFIPFRFSVYDTYLDASEVPSEADPNDLSKYQCPSSGSVNANYTRAAGEEHKKGDTFALEYNKCDTGDGFTHTGSVEGEYLSIEGYNKGFADLTVQECSVIFIEEFSPDRIVEENAYDMAIFNEGSKVIIQYLDFDSSSNTGEVRSRYEVTSQEVVLVVNSNLDALTPYYQVKDLKIERLDCESYERRLELEIDIETESVDGATDFTLAYPIAFSLKGSLDFYQAPAFGSEQVVIEADQLVVSWSQNQEVNEYVFKDIVVNLRSSDEADSYRMNTDGELDLPGVGVVVLENPQSVTGYSNKLYPNDGLVVVNGRVPDGVTDSPETVILDFFDTFISLRVAPDGDETGTGLPEFKFQFDLLWDDFWNRNFVFAEN